MRPAAIPILAVVAVLSARTPNAYRIDTIAGSGDNVGDGAQATQAFLRNPGGMAVGEGGRLFLADMGNHRLRRIDPNGTITTIAGTGKRGVEGDDGLAADAQLWEPRSVALGKDGSIYVGDGSARIRKITPDGRINTVAGSGVGGWTGDGGPALKASIGIPSAIVLDGAGNLYFSDFLYSVVRKVDTSGTITTLAGNGAEGFGGDGGPSAQAKLFAPLGLVLNAAGNLVLADYGNHRIREISLKDGTIRTVAGGGQGGDGGAATAAFIGYPCGLAIDGANNIYVGQPDARIRRVDAQGKIITFASAAAPPSGASVTWASLPAGSSPCGLAAGAGDLLISEAGFDAIHRLPYPATSGQPVRIAGAPPAQAGNPRATRLFLPQGITRDAAGDLLFADSETHRVYKLSPSGVLSVFAGNGTAGFRGDNGQALAASFTSPGAVAADSRGMVWIADSLNRRIRRVAPDGVVTTVASGEAADPASRISIPVELEPDGAGGVYFLELGRHVVRRLDSNGKLSTVAGSDEPGLAGDGGPAAAAKLAAPLGLKRDSQGGLYIADAGNGRVRYIDPAGQIRTFAGGGSQNKDGAPALQSGLSNPSRLTIDSEGCLILAEEQTGTSAGRLRKVDLEGNIWTIAGNGLSGLSGEAGLAIRAGLGSPRGLAATPDGLVYVVDSTNRVLRKLTPIRPSDMVLAGGGEQQGRTGAPLPEPLAVRVVDREGIGVPGIAIRFTVFEGDATVPASAATGANGVAMVRATAGTEPGNVRIVAEADDLGAIEFKAGIGRASTAPPAPPEIRDYRIETAAGNGTAGTGVGFAEPAAFVIDDQGRFVVADRQQNSVYRVNANGVCQTLAGPGQGERCPASERAAAIRLNGPSGVALGLEGEIFVADRLNHRVLRIDSSGEAVTIAGTGTAEFSGDDGPAHEAALNAPGFLLVEPSGALLIADTGNRRVRRVDGEGNISTVAGNGQIGGGGDGGLAVQTSLVEPAGMTITSEGVLFIIDRGAHELKAVSPDGIVKVLAGNGRAPTSEETRLASLPPSLDSPSGVAVGFEGSIYIGERGRVRQIPPGGLPRALADKISGAVVWPLIKDGRLFLLDTEYGVVRRDEGDGRIVTMAGGRFHGDGGPAADAAISQAGGIATDGKGNLYFTDQLNHRVRRIDPQGEITTIAGNGTPASTGDGGPATAAAIDAPMGIALHPDGSIFVSEFRGARIRRIQPDGIITTYAGTGRFGDSGDDGPAREARFLGPAALTLDAAGNLYAADLLAERVRKITPEGVISTVAGTGVRGDDPEVALQAAATNLSSPAALALDTAGNLLIADKRLNRILQVFPSGGIRRIAGTGQRRNAFDGGRAEETPFNQPSGIAMDAEGNLYLSDESHRIFKISPEGAVAAVAGRGPAGFSGDGGPASGASLRDPGAILTAPNGDVYFADRGNARLRRLSPER